MRYSCAWVRRSSMSQWSFELVAGKDPLPQSTEQVRNLDYDSKLLQVFPKNRQTIYHHIKINKQKQ